jgi:hypothetical protein
MSGFRFVELYREFHEMATSNMMSFGCMRHDKTWRDTAARGATMHGNSATGILSILPPVGH